jgi:hypothetical protein
MVGGKRVCPSTCRGRGPLVLAVLWGFGLCSRHGALAAVTQAQLAFPDCTAREATGSPAVHVTGNCTWSSQHHGTRVVIQGVRPSLGLYSDESATPVIFAAAAAGPAAPSTGELQRACMTTFAAHTASRVSLLVRQRTLHKAALRSHLFGPVHCLSAVWALVQAHSCSWSG